MRAFILFPALLLAQLSAMELGYRPAPPDNPLRGLVPYVGRGGEGAFPHSMEFRYFSLKELMKGWGDYDWAPLEKTLGEVSARGNQLVFRVYLEYPGKGNEVPDFLIKDGVRVTEWHSDKSDAGRMGTPDYESPVLRKAIAAFIAALGERYDGDPRIAFITAGMLGHWGEWHNYPREELWASKEAQMEVLAAFETSFPKTRILLRYPAGEKNGKHAPNAKRPFGYHDDSFGRATLETGKKRDDWFFMGLMSKAGAAEKWKQHPIGGEIAPALWETEFTEHRHEQAQDFGKCVAETHVTWLMDSGMFGKKALMDQDRVERALRETGRMGYEYHVSDASLDGGKLILTVENRGVAPFYYQWPVEISIDGKDAVKTDWKTAGIVPGEGRKWEMGISGKPESIRIRIPNPMPGGKPLGFANRETEGEWLVLDAKRL